MNKSSPAYPELGPFQFAVFVLSVFIVVALFLDWFVEVPPQVALLLRWIDNVVCALFFADFVVRFRAAESKWRFMRWGWIDLLASVPEIQALRLGRLFRIVRIVRVIRALRSLRMLFTILYRSRVRGGATSVGIIAFLVVSTSSIGVLLVETDPASNIKTAGDALWWSITTITTVGYGDRFPVTPGGRLIAAALMVTGVGLFGTLSGIVATFLLGGGHQAPAGPAPEPAANGTERELAALRAAVEHLHAELSVRPAPQSAGRGPPPA